LRNDDLVACAPWRGLGTTGSDIMSSTHFKAVFPLPNFPLRPVRNDVPWAGPEPTVSDMSSHAPRLIQLTKYFSFI
jgi:hypothetical protein